MLKLNPHLKNVVSHVAHGERKMRNAEKLNLHQLPWIFDDVMNWAVGGGFQLSALILLILIGAGEFSRVLEYIFFDVPYIRPRFWGYFYGDWPLSATGFVAVWQLCHFEGSDRFYVQPWWYAAMLGLGIVISVGFFEIPAVMGNRKNPDKGYTWQQELTLSKLAHTIGFALVFGILASLAPMTFVAGTWEQRLIAIGLVVLCVGAWAIANVLDMTLRSMTYLLVEAHPHPSRYRQKPWPWRQPVTAT